MTRTKRPTSPAAAVFAGLGAPARRALEGAGITTVRHLAACTVDEVLRLHGVGPSSLPTLEATLRAAGLHFKKAR